MKKFLLMTVVEVVACTWMVLIFHIYDLKGKFPIKKIFFSSKQIGFRISPAANKSALKQAGNKHKISIFVIDMEIGKIYICALLSLNICIKPVKLEFLL
jgi:hypothetical protein